MVSVRRALLLACTLGCAAFAASCYTAGECVIERCNGQDDDCDGRVDEDFIDADGRYATILDCGACGLRCADALPSAKRTACVIDGDGAPRCEVAECAAGTHEVPGGCASELATVCAPCDSDAECDAQSEGSLCLSSGRCGRACESKDDCPVGFACVIDDERGAPQCEPLTGSCTCGLELSGATLGCVVETRDGTRCAGEQLCDENGLGACHAAREELCNGEDDDCDGRSDEDFVDDRGDYVSNEHCGGCHQACISNAAHTFAACTRDAEGVRGPSCAIDCEPGFVDADGLAVTGCECERAPRAGPVIGADANCDGHVDETPDLIFVSTDGDDDNDGADVSRPVRTLARGLERGAATGRDVLVARGLYAGPLELRAGVRIFGGYSPDFRERDSGRNPVLIESVEGEPGEPVLRCTEITDRTRFEGFTLIGSDATTAGAGSTTVYLDRCGPNVEIVDVTVLAGRGAHGAPGDGSDARLDRVGASSLAALEGNDGSDGDLGTASNDVCTVAVGGPGGGKACGGREVSGGAGGDAHCPSLALLCDNASDIPCGNAGCTDFTEDGVCDLEAALSIAIASPLAENGQGDRGGRAGDPSYDSPTNRGVCNFCDDNPSLPREGGDGEDGQPGSDGAGGQRCEEPSYDLVRGLARAGNGQDGSDGQDGSGGGGATAGAGFAVIANTTGTCSDKAGGAGGGGGSGGCGAPGAGGGQGGGSSIGVLVRLRDEDEGTGPTFEGLRIVTASGGDGGDGGIGARGGTGGVGGLGGGREGEFFCTRDGGRGGDGGDGGDGGGGGGGCGGNSFGLHVLQDISIGYQIALENADTVLVEAAGDAGRGGRGGFSPGLPGLDGELGNVTDVSFEH